jgi:hypothetical protein
MPKNMTAIITEMSISSEESGNCFSFALSVLAGDQEENGLRSQSFIEQMTNLGYAECSQQEAEVVLKVDEDGDPYHVALVEELRTDGNHVLRHRFGFGLPVETVLLTELTPKDSRHSFKFYKKNSSEAMSNSLYDDEGNSSYYTSNRFDNNASRYIPALRLGRLSDIQLSKPYVSHKFGYEENRVGLKEFICIPESSTHPRFYFVDEHHHVAYCWAEARVSGLIQDSATLAHIDDHGDEIDTNTTNQSILVADLASVARYVNESLSEGEFIVQARQFGLVGKAYWIDDQLSKDADDPTWRESDYPKIGIDNETVRTLVEDTNLIVDIDLDYFARHLYEWQQARLLKSRGWEESIDSLLEHDILIIRELISKAKVVTVATSPGYLDPELAMFLIQKIFSPILEP